MEIYKPVEWLGDRLRIIDQMALPQEEIYLEFADYRNVASAIKHLQVRGAPAIGVAAAYALALGGREIETNDVEQFRSEFDIVAREIASTRPTARNLFRSLERMNKVVREQTTVMAIKQALVSEAIKIHNEEIDATRRISGFGADLIPDGATIMTHCNAGPLATAGYGTALGVLIEAREQGKNINVFADETRPLFQGARLTVCELQKAEVPVTLITDSMAGYFLSQGKIDVVIVGADRIAANGDTANKIGTYSIAVVAKENNVPFYVAAPVSTFDISLDSGGLITIEEREAEEVTSAMGIRTSPEGSEAANPAFDVTPHRYITAIVTEKGVLRAPFERQIKRAVGPGS